jgi:DNA-binding NtrC family response regulator
MFSRSTPATVLLVDDDPIVLHVLSGVLARAGYRVIGATSVAGALQEAQCEPNVCVLDLCLPDGSGLDLAAALDNRCPGIPMILITGSAELLRDRSERNRFARVLTKPPDVRAVRQAIAAVLNKQPAAAGHT